MQVFKHVLVQNAVTKGDFKKVSKSIIWGRKTFDCVRLNKTMQTET